MPLTRETNQADGLKTRHCLHITRGASLLVIMIGLSVLAGWITGFRPLMTVMPGFVAMKSNTAVALCLSGLSLLFFSEPAAGPQGRLRKFSTACAAMVAMIGTLTLIEYATTFRFGIDELLFRDFNIDTVARYPRGRMAPITAFNFVCLGLALVCLRFPRGKSWAHALTGCIAFTSLLALVGYFYGVSALYQSGKSTAVALHTAVAFLALCIGVWCATSRFGFMRVVMGSGTSGMLVRRYGLAVVILPFLFGWLRLQGELLGWYTTEFGSAIFAMANVMTFATLVWIGANSLRIAEGKEALVQENLRQAHADLEDRVLARTAELAEANAGLREQMLERIKAEDAFQQIMDHSLDVICTLNVKGEFLKASRASETLWGYPSAELVGRAYIEMVHPDHRKRTIAATKNTMLGEPLNDFENLYVRRDGSNVPIVWTAKWSESHQIMFCVARDMSAHKEVEATLEAANRQLRETSRRAGMAEVATSVLHNVGNVLNSVNISATLAADKIRAGCGPNLTRIADLLQKHRDNLPAYLASEQGLKVPNFLSNLTRRLAEDHGFVLAELQSLRTHIDHIKEIVAMQQSYARIAGVIEELSLESLVDDAIRLNAAALDRHSVLVIREYGDPLFLEVDKHKALQILVNLIGNAKYAMDDPSAFGKRMTLRISQDDPAFAKISVCDEGMGIPAENLNRIFEHGFTTRKEGNGFGLHSAALAARELAGSLAVCSDGPGKGALFTLSLPLHSQI